MPPSSTPNSAQLPQEREAKFVLDQAGQATALAERLVARGASFGDPTTVDHTDTYLDTPSFDLYRHGLSLRLRQHGDQRELGLKQIGTPNASGIQTRVDFSVPLDAAHAIDAPRKWPEPMVAALRPLVHKLKQLEPLVTLYQTRTKQTLTVADHDGPVAEWSVDHVAVHLPGTGPSTGIALGSFDEVELELLDPSGLSHFECWVKGLVKAPNAHLIGTGKFVRGVELVMQRRCHAMREDAASGWRELPLAEACRSILCDQLGIILYQEARVRGGEDPEAIHDMRVAIRRARAALHLFGHCYQARPLRRHVHGLKGLGRALGPVRDLDVALDNLGKFRKQVPKGERGQLKPLRKALRAQRKTAHAALVTWLDGDEHRAFVRSFAAFCTTPGRGVRPAHESESGEVVPIQVRHTLPSIVWRCFEHVRAYETVMSAAELPQAATFHALRIQAKYLRYSLEFTAPLLGDAGATLIAQMKQLQDHLGALNDASVEQHRLEEWAVGLDDRQVLVLRAESLAAVQLELMSAAPALLAQATSLHNRVLLGSALANL